MKPLLHVTTRTINVGGVPVTYHDTRRDAPVVVLVHGAGGSAERDFGPILPMLANDQRVIGIDMASGVDAENLELSDLVSQVDAVVRDAGLGSGSPMLVGYSLGAVVAAKLAADRPGFFAQLVLMNGWARTDAHQVLRTSIWRRLRAEDSKELGRLRTLLAHSPRFLLQRPPAQLEAMPAGTGTDRNHLLQMELSARIDISDALGRIDVPTLVISSADDAMVPPHHADQLLGAILNARLAVIPGGHAAMDEAPAQIYNLIARFQRDDLPATAGDVYRFSRV